MENINNDLICGNCRYEWTISGTTLINGIQCPICNSLHWAKKPMSNSEAMELEWKKKGNTWN